MIVIDNSKWTEDKQPPWYHVPLGYGLTPFDSLAWDSDAEYRNTITANYVYPPVNLRKVYEETVPDYMARTKTYTLFRAIRIRSQKKNLPNELAQAMPVEIQPEGGTQGLFTDLKTHLGRMGAYQQLSAWPKDVDIVASLPTAHALPIQHVSGDNYATQFMSTALRPQRARVCSMTSYATGAKAVRACYEWSPIIEIDLARLPQDCRLVDLSTEELRRKAGFFPSDPRSHTVGGMAEADGEVLIVGRVPAGAVISVMDVVTMVALEKDDLYQGAIKGRTLPIYSEKEEFRHLAKLLS